MQPGSKVVLDERTAMYATKTKFGTIVTVAVGDSSCTHEFQIDKRVGYRIIIDIVCTKCSMHERSIY